MLGDNAVELNRSEAEKIFVQLGHVLQDMDIEQGSIPINNEWVND